MATKQEVADYINANYESAWTAEEEAKIDAMLNPAGNDINKISWRCKFLDRSQGQRIKQRLGNGI